MILLPSTSTSSLILRPFSWKTWDDSILTDSWRSQDCTLHNKRAPDDYRTGVREEEDWMGAVEGAGQPLWLGSGVGTSTPSHPSRGVRANNTAQHRTGSSESSVHLSLLVFYSDCFTIMIHHVMSEQVLSLVTALSCYATRMRSLALLLTACMSSTFRAVAIV